MKTISIFLVLLLQKSQAVRLLRRELTGYSLAKCNDGTTASYFYDQDIRAAGRKVLIYLPDSGHCSSAEECRTRCSADSPDLASCTAAAEAVLELSEGIWSSDADTNPFADYFKVYIHSCSNDDFSGTRTSSRLTSDLYFHGKHILTSALQDLVASFGINTAERVVLAGSGSGARGVGYNCDYVSEAITSVNPGADTRCLLDSPDLVPWWVRTEAETCRGRDLNTVEREQLLWAKQPDQSCVEAEAARTNSLVSEAAHVCGLFSRYWRHLATPFFLIASQYDPVQFSGSACGPAPASPQLPAYQLSWRRGVLALLQAMVAARPGQVGVFSANCDSHLVLAGVLAQPYWTRLAVPRYEAEQEAASLSNLVASWGRGEAAVAVDSLLRNNSACVTAAPHRRHGACMGRLASCAGDTRAQLLPSLARAGHGGWGRGLIRRLAPPSHIWPATFDQHRRCGLDPYYSGCGNVNLLGSRSGCGGCGLGAAAGTFLGGGGDRVVPESAIPAAGRKGRLWRRFYYLQYLKLLYNKLKTEYAREYYLASRHRGHALPGVVRGYSSIKAPISHGQDYADYYDDYYDYDYPGDDLFARIVKAVKKNKKENPGNGLKDPSKILINSVQENFEFPKELLEALPDIDDIEYEDFESLNEQVESFNQIRRKKNIHQS